jgi:MSHA biogenesis protein MshI
MFNRQTQPGWMALALRPQQLVLAHVVRDAGGAKPRLVVLDSVQRERGSDDAALSRLRRSMGLQRHRCTTLLDPGACQFVQVNAPSVPADELKSALRWAVKDSLDFPADDAVIDALNVPADGAPAGRAPLAFAVVARREKVAARVQAFQRAKLPLKAIDSTETAQRNVAALFEERGRGLAMLAFHAHGGLLTFTRDGELFASRHIDIAAGALALADDADVSRRDALFERIGLEVQRSLDNFDRQFSQIALQRVVVAAPAGAAALVNYLAANLYLPVETADLTTVMDTSAFPALNEPTEQAQWLEAIGIALRSDEGQAPQQINLYEPSLRIAHDWLSTASLAAALGGALLAVGLAAAYTQWQLRALQAPARDTAAALQTQQAAIQELARQIDTLRPDPKLLADVASAQSTLEQRQAALQMVRAGGLGHQEGHAAALQAFARQSIDGLWLTGLALDRRDMALRGRALSPSLIPAYVGRLNQEPALQGRSFRALDIARPLEASSPATPPAAPRLAAFVEFSLAGSNGTTVQENKK